jgi:hypothetical protein
MSCTSGSTSERSLTGRAALRKIRRSLGSDPESAIIRIDGEVAQLVRAWHS